MSLPPPTPPRPRAPPPPVPEAPAAPAAPKWLTETKTCDDSVPWIMRAPGTEENHFIFEKSHFKDILIEIGDVFLTFVDCTFERSHFEGHSSKLSVIRPHYIDQKTPQINPRRLRVVGGPENPLHFDAIDFAHLQIDFSKTHAFFENCRFIQCVFEGFECTVIQHPRFEPRPSKFEQGYYYFYVLASDERIYGRLEAQVAAPEPAPVRRSVWALWKQRIQELVVAV